MFFLNHLDVHRSQPSLKSNLLVKLPALVAIVRLAKPLIFFCISVHDMHFYDHWLGGVMETDKAGKNTLCWSPLLKKISPLMGTSCLFIQSLLHTLNHTLMSYYLEISMVPSHLMVEVCSEKCVRWANVVQISQKEGKQPKVVITYHRPSSCCDLRGVCNLSLIEISLCSTWPNPSETCRAQPVCL